MGRPKNPPCVICGGPTKYIGKNEWGQCVYECPKCAAEYEDDDIPEGCIACGGPYPECMTSCNMFDD